MIYEIYSVTGVISSPASLERNPVLGGLLLLSAFPEAKSSPLRSPPACVKDVIAGVALAKQWLERTQDEREMDRS
jgi:hypothetical protein